MWQAMERGEDCFRIFTLFFAAPRDGAEEREDER